MNKVRLEYLWTLIKYPCQHTGKTVKGEKTLIETHIMLSKAEAKAYRVMLRERYECEVEMNVQPNVGFDYNTGREYPGNGLRCVFYIFPNRALVKGV